MDKIKWTPLCNVNFFQFVLFIKYRAKTKITHCLSVRSIEVTLCDIDTSRFCTLSSVLVFGGLSKWAL